MDSSSPASPRRTYDIPRPETGLAEWTNKIKALQREVDADEEAEQKRLEEEIAAAREARLMRSRGVGGGNRADNLDLTSHKHRLGASDDPSGALTDHPPKPTEREGDGETAALRKLMEKNNVYNPDKIAGAGASPRKAESMSLAALIGGRATGPRLNKHAPQQDTHDPTQFVQPDLSSPHPVFGRGGVAMPGLVTRKDIKSSPSLAGSEFSERYRPSTIKAASSVTNSPSAKVDHTNEANAPDLHRHSYLGVSKSISGASDAQTPKAESSLGHIPISTAQVGLSKANSSSLSSISIAKIDEGNTYDIAPEASSSASPSSSASSLPKRPLVELTTAAQKSIDLLESTQSSPNPVSKTTPLPSYLPMKRDASDQSSDSFSKKSAGALQSNYMPRNKLPSYLRASEVPRTSGTPLQRIMEKNNVYNPDKNVIDEQKTVVKDSQVGSLAAFIGGGTRGPRLNRHAPQEDVHDPTQFVLPDSSAAHPIFGRGGIAMPGLVAPRNTAPEGTGHGRISEHFHPSLVSRTTWPSSQDKPLDKANEAPALPLKTGDRKRTTSAPDAQVPNVSASQSSGAFSSNRFAGRQLTRKEVHDASSLGDHTIHGSVYPSQFSQSPLSSTSTLSLAGPNQPIRKASSHPSKVPNTTPSIFQKPPPAKELTPSISRLQGRGFVQNMVKASAQREISPSLPSNSEKSFPTSTSGKKAPVLERWQPGPRASSPPKSTVSAYAKSVKVTFPQDSPSDPGTKSSPYSLHAIKSTSSMPSLTKVASAEGVVSGGFPKQPEPYQRSRTPGLGSATTMVLIKPNLPEIPHVDELGVKHSHNSQNDAAQFVRPSQVPPSSKKPLIHPTKDRARKPRKHRQTLNSPKIMSYSTSRAQAGLNDYIEMSPDIQATYPAGPVILENKGEHNQEREEAGALDADITTSDVPSTDFKVSRLDRSSSPSMLPVLPHLSPVKPSRIPSTGKRPTVMELAQTLLKHPDAESPLNPGANAIQDSSFIEYLPSPNPCNDLPQIQVEKRKSSYEKYSSMPLPSLKEEIPLSPSPAGILLRETHRSSLITVDNGESAEESPWEKILGPVASGGQGSEETVQDDLLNICHDDSYAPITNVDLHFLLTPQFNLPQPSSDVQTVSTELFTITGTTATLLSRSSDIFYEAETIVIIHRIKSRSSGLAFTSVWCWLGRKSTLGDREDRKVCDMAKRYGTNAKYVHQLAEPPELIQILGGRLAIRQGSRMHWNPENTTMHIVRSFRDVIVIDEIDMSIKNMCSAFSYCVTVLGSIYIWNGRGSTRQEREAAFQYATTFFADSVRPIVLTEGEDDEDEMFWMILGNETFANAHYWRWRKDMPSPDPSVWRLNTDSLHVFAVEFISMEKELQKSIYIINCIWEFFVLVGREARSNRRAIRFALELAKDLSSESASFRPYVPTVHVLILPSQIPLDLRLGIRDMDEAWLNDGEIPDHMNLLHYSEAVSHLTMHSWEQSVLQNPK